MRGRSAGPAAVSTCSLSPTSCAEEFSGAELLNAEVCAMIIEICTVFLAELQCITSMRVDYFTNEKVV